MGSIIGKNGNSTPPTPPNLAALVPQQQNLNLQSFNTQLGAGRVSQNTPDATTGWTQDPKTGQWTQNTSLTGPAATLSNTALTGAASAAGSYNPAQNPTFNPAATEQGIYSGAMSLLEPGMQSQMTGLKSQLGAEGFDTTGGSTNGDTAAINNLDNQQNLTRANVAGQAQSLAIPQAAQAVSAESQAQQSPLQSAGMLASTGLSPMNNLPTGQAQTPGLATPDLLGATQQSFSNSMVPYNAEQAQQGNVMNGLFGLGAAALS